MFTSQDEWNSGYAEGRRYRPLNDDERTLLARHVPAPDGGRALDVGCGTGELALHLASMGYTVDAVDWADAAFPSTDAHHDHGPSRQAVRRLHLDIERANLSPLHSEGYDLIVLRMVYAFLRDRTRLARTLGRRLRTNGALVVVTPLAATTPAERRGIALDEDEIAHLTSMWDRALRFDANGMAVLVLRGLKKPAVQITHTPLPQSSAVTAVHAVVTDPLGRVLLGRSEQRGWELPGAPVAPGEGFEDTAVRALAEQTGVMADPSDAHVIGVHLDAPDGLSRTSATVRITAHAGPVQPVESDVFGHVDWRAPHAVRRLDRLSATSARALDLVWPGVLPYVPSARAYPVDGTCPPVPGESPEAVERRERMADRVIGGGWAPSLPVQQALRTVPRHRYTPESTLRTAYHSDLAVVTEHNHRAEPTSSVSAAWLQADMAEHLRLAEGMTVFEGGSGGYNAELIAYVVGPAGRVITVDLSPYVVRRTRRLTAEAGSGRVTAVLGSATDGAAAHMPRGGFDASVITYNCWDIAPAWRDQLADGRFLVLPLEVHGYTRAIAFRKHGRVLRATDFTFCGFVRDRGPSARAVPAVDLADGELQLRFPDGVPAETAALDDAFAGPRHEVATGVTVAGNESFETLQLFLATTLPGFCRLARNHDRGSGIAALPKRSDAATITADGSLAHLTHVFVQDGRTPEQRRSEFLAHGFGPSGPALAEQLAAAVRRWDVHERAHGYPELEAHPAGTPDAELPAGHVLDKTHSRLVWTWRSDAAYAPAVRPEKVSAHD
ncbi:MULTISPECIES: methyltransferase, FxLD system [unclassified Streptomyces]|uniref:methyltransferase, FxLD system n=1 Tax=unclassified Streptomyces TaxID=2593676 RepID=UPI00038206ED|nr:MULTISPECIES: methyltransferase, FxLD system [unclassified Streptomyces]